MAGEIVISSLPKFLLDTGQAAASNDQSSVPVQEQYEAVGHAVRATYTYSVWPM